jgi:hypothetical protein
MMNEEGHVYHRSGQDGDCCRPDHSYIFGRWCGLLPKTKNVDGNVEDRHFRWYGPVDGRRHNILHAFSSKEKPAASSQEMTQTGKK